MSTDAYGKFQCVCHTRIERTDKAKLRGNDDERLALSERAGKPDDRIHPRRHQSVEIDRAVYSAGVRGSIYAAAV
jgi:hypothetical protein